MTEKDINIVEIAPIIPNELFKLINVELNKILEKICDENNLNSKMIIEKYSNDISKIGSSSFTTSPTWTNQRSIVPSVTVSPNWGIVTI